MKSASTGLAGTCLLLLLAAGCGPRQAYVVETLAVRHAGWDTLEVTARFGQRVLLGRARPAAPRALAVYLFDAAYDTLYAGAARRVPVPDAALGDRERLLLEVCGAFEAETVCEQQTVWASPKRLRLDPDLTFPDDAAFERGSYDLRVVVEREVFDASGWERIDRPDAVQGYLLAYVGEAAGEAVRVPFSQTRGRFDLTRYAHFEDFRYHLKSQLLDRQEAAVRFDVYAGLNGQEAYRLASIEKRVRAKTDEERRMEVGFFAEQAAARLLERLDVDAHERQAGAYVDGWDFNRITGAYVVEMTVVWREGGRLFGRLHELEGLLEVQEDGAEARFLLRASNERAARRWRRHTRSEVLPLGTLDVYHPEDEAPLQAEGGLADQE